MRQMTTALLARVATGADWSFVPAAGDRARLVSITAELVTSSTVAVRAVDLKITDVTGNLIALDHASATQAASLTYLYGWRPGAASYGFTTGDDAIINSCAEFWLPAGAEVSSSTVAIATGDQWSLVVATYLVCSEWEWLQLEEAALLGVGAI